MTQSESEVIQFNKNADIPTMSFLRNPRLLELSVDPTIEKCEALLQSLKDCKTPQEIHDTLDTVSNVLCLLLDPCEMVRQIHPDGAYKDAAMSAFARGHSFMCDCNSRRELYDFVAKIAEPDNMAQLDPEARKNVVQLKRDMEGNGIHLPERQRSKITEMNIEKEELAMQFIQEVDSKNPFGVLIRLLRCRYDLSQLLGFESFAEQQLRGTMLENQEQVWHFLCAVGNKYGPEAHHEVERLRNFQGEVGNRSPLKDIDRAKISQHLRNQYEAIGYEQYFTVGNCIRGIQHLCEEVFGIKLKKVDFDDDENLGPDGMKFHVYDDRNRFKGIIVLDMFARASKHCQAGHITVQLGCKPHQYILDKVGMKLPEHQYPIVVLTCNAGSQIPASKKADGSFDEETSLMLPHEVTTAFHEFGHALHTICGQTTVQNLAGTRGTVDFVECWSQLFEQFLTSHDFLKLWAHKLDTREPIPIDILQRRNEVNNMFRNLDTLDQVVLASIDQTLHGPQPFVVYFPTTNGNLGKRTLGNMGDYGKGIFNLAKIIIDTATPLTPVIQSETGVLRSLSFEHLSSYPAAYYGYLYSGAFARRIWEKNFRDKPLNRTEGNRLVDQVLKYGAACNTREVMSSYLGENIDNIEAWI